MGKGLRSSIVKVREGAESLRVTIPEGVVDALGAAPGMELVWSIDLKAGRVTVTAELPESDGKKSSKRR